MSANYGDMVIIDRWEHRRPILTQEKPWIVKPAEANLWYWAIQNKLNWNEYLQKRITKLIILWKKHIRSDHAKLVYGLQTRHCYIVATVEITPLFQI